VSLYLKIVIGAGRYLLDAAQIVEIVERMPGNDGGEPDRREPVQTIDLRVRFGALAGGPGAYVLVRQTAGETVGLAVDRVEDLTEIADSEFRPLPPIGPAGVLIDAASLRLFAGRPLLRLRGERVSGVGAHQIEAVASPLDHTGPDTA
jgi:chemotaxis signal transduction protein